MDYTYKGFAVAAAARQINKAPNEAWRPLYRINGKDQSTSWTPRDRAVIFGTEMKAIKEAQERAQWMIDNSPDYRGFFEKASPFGRVGRADEIAAVVAFLCSPEASWVSGTHILVNGAANA